MTKSNNQNKTEELKSCRYYKGYKAIFRPKCKCIPCREKYIDRILNTRHSPVTSEEAEKALMWFNNEIVCLTHETIEIGYVETIRRALKELI